MPWWLIALTVVLGIPAAIMTLFCVLITIDTMMEGR